MQNSGHYHHVDTAYDLDMHIGQLESAAQKGLG